MEWKSETHKRSREITRWTDDIKGITLAGYKQYKIDMNGNS